MNPFVVEVHDQYDDPMEGVTVTFVASPGGGSGSLSSEMGITLTQTDLAAEYTDPWKTTLAPTPSTASVEGSFPNGGL